jgi:hypothetical protein
MSLFEEEDVRKGVNPPRNPAWMKGEGSSVSLKANPVSVTFLL